MTRREYDFGLRLPGDPCHPFHQTRSNLLLLVHHRHSVFLDQRELHIYKNENINIFVFFKTPAVGMEE